MTEDKQFLPFALPEIGEEEISEVVDCLRSGWLTTGPRVKRFEEAFAERLGVKHALAVNSGTAGLHLALEAAGVGPGDKVVTTVMTFTATAEVARYLGADPVFVDIDPETLNMDPAAAARAVRTQSGIKAVLPVHHGGRTCDMGPILAAADDTGAVVVEDAAHALPSAWQGQNAGTLGLAGAFSFYATKTLATGEGGMVVTDSDEVARRMQVMRLHGISRPVWDRYTSDRPSWYYEVVEPGYKYNMPDIMAAIGLQQIKKVDRFHARRREIAEMYRIGLADLPLQTPPPEAAGDLHAWHLYVIRLNIERLGIDRDGFIRELSELGIGTSVHYTPLHLQPYWRDRYGLKPDDFPAALDSYRRIISLPIYTRLTNDDVARIVEAVRTVALKWSL